MAKNKMKTKRAAAKRFKVTGSGKIMRRKAYKGHLTASMWQGEPDYLVGAYLQVQIHLSQSKYDEIYASGKRYIKITVDKVDVYGASRMPSKTVAYLSLSRVNIWNLKFDVEENGFWFDPSKH